MDTAGCIDGDRMWGFTVSLVRAIFASEKHSSDADSQVADTEPFHSKSGIYASDSEPNDVNAYTYCPDMSA